MRRHVIIVHGHDLLEHLKTVRMLLRNCTPAKKLFGALGTRYQGEAQEERQPFVFGSIRNMRRPFH
jgi:hypothetical protein